MLNTLPSFTNTLTAWGTPQFENTVKREIINLGVEQLPLQQGLTSGNHVTDDPITVLINHCTETDTRLHIVAGIFYQSLMLGCSCADDPSTASTANEYCEIQLDIDKSTAIATVALVS